MNTQFWLVQAFNGVSYGALLFLVGSGLSLIFGVMRIVNLSHGSYFLLGGYIALSVIHTTGSWALSLPVAAFAYLAFYFKQHQPSGAKLIELPDWKLFFLPREGVELRQGARGVRPADRPESRHSVSDRKGLCVDARG